MYAGIVIKSHRKDDAIWLIAGGSMQTHAAESILENGYKLILTDINANCSCQRYADEFIELDTFDIKGNLKAANKLKDKYRIRAVLTVAADCHETVAHLAKELGLQGIDPVISRLCRFKFNTRKVLTQAGIPQPKFRKVKSVSELYKAVMDMDLPVVIKSSNNSGSRGFTKIERREGINAAVLTRAKEAGTTGYAVVEECLSPVTDEVAEQSVETLWYDGKMCWLNWVDRLFRKDFKVFDCVRKSRIYSGTSWAVELGHINPAVHNRTIRKNLNNLLLRAGLAIGMGNTRGGHILKADVMLTPHGHYILELTPRLSGGWDSSKTTLLRGADFISGAIHLALGERLDRNMWNKFFKFKNPEIFASVLAKIDKDAKDCISRLFACGTALNREESINKALHELIRERYIES